MAGAGARSGRDIRARTTREEWQVFSEVDEEGQLVLETAKGRLQFLRRTYFSKGPAHAFGN